MDLLVDHCQVLLLAVLVLLLVVVARLVILTLILPSAVLVNDVHHLFDEMPQRGYLWGYNPRYP